MKILIMTEKDDAKGVRQEVMSVIFPLRTKPGVRVYFSPLKEGKSWDLQAITMISEIQDRERKPE